MNKRDMCIKCRNKSIGCEKFCTVYKNSFESCLDSVKMNLRIKQREAEIAQRVSRKGVKRNEKKSVRNRSF